MLFHHSGSHQLRWQNTVAWVAYTADLFSHSSGGRMSESRVPVWSGSGESFLPVHRKPSSHCVSVWQTNGSASSSSCESTNPSMRPTPPGPHPNVINSQKPHLQIWDLGLQHVSLAFCDCGFRSRGCGFRVLASSICPLMDKNKRFMQAYWWEGLTMGKTGSRFGG